MNRPTWKPQTKKCYSYDMIYTIDHASCITQNLWNIPKLEKGDGNNSDEEELK